MSAEDKKSDVFSYFEKGKGEFLAKNHTISLKKEFSYTSSHLR